MEKAFGVIPSVAADSQRSDVFQQEVTARLLSIEAKLDDVVQQFLNHGFAPTSNTNSRYTLMNMAEKLSLEGATPIQRQRTPSERTSPQQQIRLPGACPDEMEADEADVLHDAVKETNLAKEEKQRNNSSSSSSSNSSNSSSNPSSRLKTPKMPHVDLDRGATWIDGDEAPQKHNTIQRLSHKYGLNGTVKRMRHIHGRPSQESIDRRKKEPLWCFVHSSRFRTMCSTMVVLNVLFVGVLTEVELQSATDGRIMSGMWTIGNIIFCFYFLVEIGLRLLAERTLFFNGPHFRWNTFDSLVVILSLMDIAIELSQGSPQTKSLVLTRILRLSRLMRVMSMARVMRACHSLRLVVLTILESMSSLAWCFLVLGLIMFLFAIFVVQGVTAHLHWQNDAADGGTAQQLELRATLLDLFGGIPAAVICLFMMVSGGLDWRDAMLPMKEVHDFYEYFFTLYVFFMVIGVLNVVVGAFVAATAEIAARDRDLVIKSEMAQLTTYLEKVRGFFSAADVDASGKLSLAEFKSHLNDKRMCAYLHALGIDVSQGELLFHLLEKDDDHMLSLNEFLSGCMRLRGNAKSLDVNLLLYETRQLSRRFANLQDAIAETVVDA